MNHSKQREVVKNVVCGKRWHPTASEIFVEAKKIIPKISLGTVYRDLNQLCEAKAILKVVDETGETRFDGTVADHVHFLCTKCGVLLDIENENAQKILKSTFKCAGNNRVNSCCILLKGECEKCASEK